MTKDADVAVDNVALAVVVDTAEIMAAGMDIADEN